MNVSVCITTFNRKAFVRKAIASVLSQTFQPHEIIVVSDGCTDDTLNSLKSYNIRVLHNEENQGCAAAKNVAIEASTGSVIAFLDSDDCWEDVYLERMLPFALNGFATYCRYFLRFPLRFAYNDREVFVDRPLEEVPFDYQLLESLPIHSPSLFMIRRDLIGDIRFDPSFTIVNDLKFYLDLWKAGVPFHHTPESLATIYVGHDRLSNDGVTKRREMEKVRELFYGKTA
jgi:glycosyltransferase involved in cell wall biosynthesis